MEEKITFKIESHLGVLESFPTGWSKELNIVSWNGNPGKYDIRDWSPDRTKMSKGITLSGHQIAVLDELLEDELSSGF